MRFEMMIMEDVMVPTDPKNTPPSDGKLTSAAPEISDEAKKWEQQRKPLSQQDQELKEVGFKWLARIPQDARPLEVARAYPRIANKLAELWPQRRACMAYLEELLIDHRGTRKGFPLKVALELATLKDFYHTHVFQAPKDVWDETPDLGRTPRG